MRKLVALCALLLFIGYTNAQVVEHPVFAQVIVNPVYERTSFEVLHPHVDKIELKKDSTKVYCSINYQESWSYNIPKTMFIEDLKNHKKYQITKCIGLPFEPEERVFSYGESFQFIFCFPHIDGLQKFNMIEDTSKDRFFNIYGIDISSNYPQTFEETEYKRFKSMSDFYKSSGNNNKFVVFGDPKQNVYHRPIDSNGDIRLGVIRSEWNRQLSTGRRFTNPRLATLATTFQTKFLSNQPVDTINTATGFDNTLNFQIVTYCNMRGSFTMENLVSKLTEIINNSNNNPKDFVVLASYSKLLQTIDSKYRETTGEETEITFVSTEQYERLKELHKVSDEHPASWKFNRDYEALGRTRKQLFTTDKRCLKLSTIKSFKGWESPSVIIILDDEYNAKAACRRPMEPEMMYTAITRARESLYIINIGNETYDKFFKEQTI